MPTAQLSPERPCTTNHHASKRRAAVWSALLSVLMLTPAVVTPAVAAPPGSSPGGTPPVESTTNQRCADLYRAVYDAFKKAGASNATADAEARKAETLCYEKIGRKKKL
jgi:hypothetical protein